VVAVLALLVAGCDDGDGGPIVSPLGPPVTTGPAHRATTGLDGDTGTVDLVSAATTVSFRSADLPGGTRVQADTPDGAGIAPALTVDGDTVSVHLVQTGRPGPAAVTVLLDPAVRWQVRMSGGATGATFDLRGARLSGVDLLAGVTRIELRLPVPDRAVPVRMAGGATELTVHVPDGVATGVRVGGGAGTVVVDGVRRTGLAGGTTVTSSTATDRYDVDATAGVSTLVLDRA
jgi:hypothetical protein